MKKTVLTMDHSQLVTKHIDAMGMYISEFCFPNLYLFRNTHQYELVETDHIFISGLTYDKKRYLMPMTSPEKTDGDCFAELKELFATRNWDFLFPIPQEWLSCFDKEKFHQEYNPNDSDYLFLTEKFKTYPGKKMHKKKNQLNQFLKNHENRFEPLSDDSLKDAKSILETWQKNSYQELSTSDYGPCMEALETRSELGLTGAIAYADGQPVGFVMGEALNNDTFTIHFAKADTSFKGVYQFLFSRFANDFCPDYRYMNLEQDMGNEGLRKTKISYRPDLMAHKYRISFKAGNP